MTAFGNVILFATNSHPDIYLLEMTTTGNNPTNRLFRFKGSYLLKMITTGNSYIVYVKHSYGIYLLEMTTIGNTNTLHPSKYNGSYLLNMTTIRTDYLNLYKAKFGPYLLNVTTIVSIIYHYLSFIMVLTYLIWQTSETLFYFSTNSHPDIYLLKMTAIGNTRYISLYHFYLLEMSTTESSSWN